MGHYWLSSSQDKPAMVRMRADEIAATLRKRIAAGQWAETGRIPPERDLAREFKVARNTIRRAFELLREDGIVTRHVGRGTFVSTPRPSSLADIAQRMAGAGPADMMEIRLLIEPAAAAVAATSASATQLARIEKAHHNATTASALADFEHWDTEFHQLICDCSRNDLLREIHNVLTVLRNQSQWFEMKRRSFSDELRLAYCNEHGRINEAITRRLPAEARNAMHDHLTTVGRNILHRHN